MDQYISPFPEGWHGSAPLILEWAVPSAIRSHVVTTQFRSEVLLGYGPSWPRARSQAQRARHEGSVAGSEEGIPYPPICPRPPPCSMGAVEGPPTTVGGPPVVCCAACGHPSPRGGETLGGGATNLTPQEIIQEKENSWGGQKKACVWQEGDQRGFPIFMRCWCTCCSRRY